MKVITLLEIRCERYQCNLNVKQLPNCPFREILDIPLAGAVCDNGHRFWCGDEVLLSGDNRFTSAGVDGWYFGRVVGMWVCLHVCVCMWTIGFDIVVDRLCGDREVVFVCFASFSCEK